MADLPEDMVRRVAAAIKCQSLDLRPVATSVAHGTLDEARAIAAIRALTADDLKLLSAR